MAYRPLIAAHRGASRDFPENTRRAFNEALLHPVDLIETDIQMSCDGIPVLFHDHTLEKLDYEKKSVSECSYKELQELDFGLWKSPEFRGEKILTLKEALETYAEKTIFMLEFKSQEKDRLSGHTSRTLEESCRIIRESPGNLSADNIYILSFDRALIEQAIAMQNNFRYVINIEGVAPSLAELSGYPADISGFCLNIDSLSGKGADLIRESGRKVMTYSCNTGSELDLALSVKADLIMTDRPGWLSETIKKRPLWGK